MKRRRTASALAGLLALLLLCIGCGSGAMQDSKTQAIMVDGVVWCSTGMQVAGDVDESAILGRIRSVVPASEWPTEDGQANFDALDAPYAMTRLGEEDCLVVLIDLEWTKFERRDTET